MPIGFFPAPYPGETFYSICSRYHHELGGSSASATSKELLGVGSGFRYPDLPICLGHFNAVTGNGFGPDVLLTRSGAAPYLSLMGTAKLSALRQASFQGAPATALARSGLSRYTANAKLLKFCPSCVKEQIATNKTSYWLSLHQRAGTWFCGRHRKILSYLRHPGTATFGWKLPHEVYEEAQAPALPVEVQLKLLELAEVMNWICSLSYVDTVSLQIMLRWRLRARRLVRTEQKWLQVERDHVCMLAERFALDIAVPDVRAVANKQWMRALLGDARHYDALAWGMGLLFSGATSNRGLTEEYRDAQRRTPERVLFDAERISRSLAPNAAYEAFDGALSLKEASDRGVLDRAELASWLRRDSALQDHWHHTRRARLHSRAVQEISSYLIQFPAAKRVDILRKRTASVRWLEVNDREQLERLLPSRHIQYVGQVRFDFRTS